MALTSPTPPAAVRKALAAGVLKLMDRNDPLRDSLKDAQNGLQVFFLPLDSAKTGGPGIRAATRVGWRFMVRKDGKSACGHVREQFRGNAPRMTGVSKGPTVRSEEKSSVLQYLTK